MKSMKFHVTPLCVNAGSRSFVDPFKCNENLRRPVTGYNTGVCAHQALIP